MGIGMHALEFLLHEHCYKPITGELLTIGKQAVQLAPETILTTMGQYGLTPNTNAFDLDLVNQHVGNVAALTDSSLFAAFSDCRVLSADISDYEGADFVFDICGKVPRALRNRFQFIVDGGSLDNVFDPFRMLENMTEMLAPGGRIFIFAWSNSHPTAYVKVSPDWLMDYFAVNEFADCKIYPVEFPNPKVRENRIVEFTVYHYDPYVVHSGQIGYECSSITSRFPLQTYCIAEKGRNSTGTRTAVQKHYRNGANEPYLESIKRFRESPRPIFRSPSSTSIDVPSISDFNTVLPVTRWSFREGDRM